MEFESLRIFLAVADHGGLLAAARALELPKQTVSRRLAALEAEIGVELLAHERAHPPARLEALLAAVDALAVPLVTPLDLP